MLSFFILDDIVEVIIVVVVVAVICFFVWLYNSATTSVLSGNTAGGWSVTPTSINPSPGVGTFVYHVDFTPKGGALAPYPPPGREIKFSLQGVSKGSGTIANITDRAGQRQVDDMSVSGFTDAKGDITLQVFLEKNMSASLVATDVKSGKSDPAISFKADL